MLILGGEQPGARLALHCSLKTHAPCQPAPRAQSLLAIASAGFLPSSRSGTAHAVPEARASLPDVFTTEKLSDAGVTTYLNPVCGGWGKAIAACLDP